MRAALNVASIFRPSFPGASVVCGRVGAPGRELPGDADRQRRDVPGAGSHRRRAARPRPPAPTRPPRRPSSAAHPTTPPPCGRPSSSRPAPTRPARPSRRSASASPPAAFSSAARPVISAEPDSAPGCVQNGGRPLTEARRFAGTVPVVIVHLDPKLAALNDPAPESWMNSFWRLQPGQPRVGRPRARPGRLREVDPEPRQHQRDLAAGHDQVEHRDRPPEVDDERLAGRRSAPRSRRPSRRPPTPPSPARRPGSRSAHGTRGR